MTGSPSGDLVAFGVGNYVAVVNLNASHVWVMNSFSEEVEDIAWCPDGSCVAAATEKRMIVFSANGTILRESDAVGEKFLNLAWSPDGPSSPSRIGEVG